MLNPATFIFQKFIRYIFNSFKVYSFVLQSIQVYFAVPLRNLISMAAIPVSYFAFIFQFSLPCKSVGKARVL
jgi:hypothetical protein